MTKKTNLAILFGGKSTEHEVSLQSAKNVFEALDKEKYQVFLIGIDKQGRWHLCAEKKLFNTDSPRQIRIEDCDELITLIPGGKGRIIKLKSKTETEKVDVVFPILHGPLGEDGTIQGLLKIADVPFVGAGVLGSAVGMDKDVMKRLLKETGISVAKFLVYDYKESQPVDFNQVVGKIGLPFFAKPANTGSSVGINKVHNAAEFQNAVQEAFQFDRKIILEEYIQSREIECSVLGNDNPQSSLPGEVIPKHEFYSYEAKYLDENGAILKIPAQLELATSRKIQNLAVRVFKVLNCEGLARVDFFLKDDGQIFVNEINTIPGFTSISMYPKLWEKSGISYAALIDRLIRLAMERAEREQKISTSYRV